MARYSVHAIDVDVCDLQTATARIVDAAVAKVPLRVHLCNTYTFACAERDTGLRDILRSSELNIPDGVPISLIGWRHGQRGSVRGPDLINACMALGIEEGIGHYFLGGQAGVAQLVSSRLSRSFHGLKIVGAWSPGPVSVAHETMVEMASRIRQSGADIVWLGLGTPKQDLLADALTTELGVPVIPIGAAFDFIAGTVREAPQWLRGSGFEWLYRLSREPGRLWRRYLVDGPRFVLRQIVIACTRER